MVPVDDIKILLKQKEGRTQKVHKKYQHSHLTSAKTSVILHVEQRREQKKSSPVFLKKVKYNI